MKWIMITLILILLVGCTGTKTGDVVQIIEKPDVEVPIEETESEQIEEVIIEEVVDITTFDYLESACDGSVDVTNMSKMGIISIDWSGKDRVTITAFLPMNCAEDIKKADFMITENEFYLTYAIDHCLEGECTDCMCAKKVTFVVDGIENKKYQYKLVGL